MLSDTGSEPQGSANTLTDETRPSPQCQPRNPDEAMQRYQDYVSELHRQHPDTYDKLRNFIDRGNCKCLSSIGNCSCVEIGNLCICPDLECRCSKDGTQKCQYRTIEHNVRVYDIYPEEKEWKKFLVPEKYNAGNREGFEKLKNKLFGDTNIRKESQDVDEVDEDEWDNHLKERCRLITVNHLSANVAKLLGGIFDIEADFFNRHLPGTEAISGRLISRLPSSVQIDFDELYESTNTFSDIWKGREKQDGHKFISQAMKRNFLFQDVGHDYFPVEDDILLSSFDNSRLSSGYEVASAGEVKNIFQFNLTHRISVYSQPPGHPTTAIIIFYPTLPICGIQEHYTKKCRHVDCPTTKCNLIYFRGVPDTVPRMSTLKFPPENLEDVEIAQRPSNTVLYGRSKGRLGFKQDYAEAFEREFRLDAKRHCDNKAKEGKDLPSFVHIFGVPLFKIVAANWARLVVRRKFDLDLLEWRPLERMTQETVEEIKSRRIAIARHQRDIAASVEVLKGLTQEERVQKLVHRHKKESQKALGDSSRKPLEPKTQDTKMDALTLAFLETNAEWNRGRSNGLVGHAESDDSWQRVYYDFFELSASMDALEKRADKIQDGILALLSVNLGMTSGNLNFIAGIVSTVLLPFTVVGAIFGIDFISGGPPKNAEDFAIAIAITFVIVFLPFLYFLVLKAHQYSTFEWLRKLKKQGHTQKGGWSPKSPTKSDSRSEGSLV